MTDSFRKASCEGKVVFESFALASTVAKRRRKRDRLSQQEAYRCDWCGRFHIGFRPRQRDRRPRPPVPVLTVDDEG